MRFLLKEIRQAKGMSQSELSRRTGISRNTIWKLESGLDITVMTGTLDKLSRALGCEIGDFFAKDDK